MQLNVKVPAAPLPPPKWSEEDGESPPAPWSPTEKHNHNFLVIVHMNSVVDRGELLDHGLDRYPSLPGEDLTRMHTFTTCRGKIDDSGPGDNGLA